MEASSEARFAVDLPNRDAPAILYIVWQRSDSPEAFYACSDVTISSDGTAAPVPPITGDGDHNHGDDDSGDDDSGDHGDGHGDHDPGDDGDSDGHGDHDPGIPSEDENAHVPSAPAPEPGGEDLSAAPAGLEVSAVHTAEWDTGRCTTVSVHNPTGSPQSWEVRYDPGGDVDALWNAEVTDGDRYRGEDWNAVVAPGATSSFGMCVSL